MEGVIIRTQNYGETHKIVTIFTRERGKIAVIARGAKKPKSRMAAITQPFVKGNFLIQQGKGLGSLQQGEVIQSFRQIREDIIKTAYGAYIAELTIKLIEDKEPDHFLYLQFIAALTAISEDKDPDIITIIYELKTYYKAGFAPVLHHCVNCQRPEQLFCFSLTDGGMLCSKCNGRDPYQQVLGLNRIQTHLLQTLAQVDLGNIANISVKEENKRAIKNVLEAYYDQYGGLYIKSKKFLKQLESLS